MQFPVEYYRVFTVWLHDYHIRSDSSGSLLLVHQCVCVCVMCPRKWGSAGGGSTQIVFQPAPEPVIWAPCQRHSVTASGSSRWSTRTASKTIALPICWLSLVMGFMRSSVFESVELLVQTGSVQTVCTLVKSSAHLRIISLLVLDSFWVRRDQSFSATCELIQGIFFFLQ